MVAEKEILDITLRGIGDGVITTDNESRVILMNEVAEKLTGWKQCDAKGHFLADIFNILDESTRTMKTNLVDKVLASGRRSELENHTILVSTSGERIIENIATPIRDDQGEIISVVLVIRDITEQKKLDDERCRANRLESVGFLAGGIAHDFNNLLTAIIGNISLARMDLDSADESHVLLAEAEKACELAKNLTGQLLTFSKGGTPIKRTACIVELLRESVNFVLRGSKVQCKFELPDKLCPVEIDEGQINQVINNLIINAIQAMPDGGSIYVRGENVRVTGLEGVPLKPGEYRKISIEDEGAGISEKDLDKIFDPYFTTKRMGTHKGQGLGLAISYSIIKRHGGLITVNSIRGEGTTFHIYLPASDKRVHKRKTNIKPFSKYSGRILVMDDEEMLRDLSKKVLCKMGFKVMTASDGDEVLKLYEDANKKKRPFDAVIMDLTVPGGMGGKETIKRLRKVDPDVKAVVSSGYSNDPVMADHKKYGFEAMLCKPFQVHELNDILSKLIN